MPMKPKIGDIVVVMWEDAYIYPNRLSKGGEKSSHSNEAIMFTVGYLIHQDKDQVELAIDMDADKIYRTIIFIPRGMVRKIIRVGGLNV